MPRERPIAGNGPWSALCCSRSGMTAGQQLAAARREHQWSLDQVADRLQVSVGRIVALERTDVRGLPSRVYLRDLVGEYAREMGLDPHQ